MPCRNRPLLCCIVQSDNGRRSTSTPRRGACHRHSPLQSRATAESACSTLSTNSPLALVRGYTERAGSDSHETMESGSGTRERARKTWTLYGPDLGLVFSKKREMETTSPVSQSRGTRSNRSTWPRGPAPGVCWRGGGRGLGPNPLDLHLAAPAWVRPDRLWYSRTSMASVWSVSSERSDPC